MNGCPVTLVAGAGPFSLGRRTADRLADRDPREKVVTIARHRSASVPRENIREIQFDLNPLTHPRGFGTWSDDLSDALMKSFNAMGEASCQNVLLCAARYYMGSFDAHPANVRTDLLGLNVCGKFELLNVVMRLNSVGGFDNARCLTVCDIGSLRALQRTPKRSFYDPSKQVGLALCEVLASGDEVARCFHLAPGPIDTPMLHWSHWVLQEGGDRNVFSQVLHTFPDLYDGVFRNCDQAAFEESLARLGCPSVEPIRTFERYVRRRSLALQSAEGVTDPHTLAVAITELLGDPQARSGVYIISSPSGRLRVEWTSFVDVRPNVECGGGLHVPPVTGRVSRRVLAGSVIRPGSASLAPPS